MPRKEAISRIELYGYNWDYMLNGNGITNEQR